MRLGIVNQETWDFLNPVFPALAERYQTTVFRARQISPPVFATRINRRLLHRDLSAFLRDNDVVFFEFASELLATATRLPKTCAIVARLHRYELYDWAQHVNWDAVDRLVVVSEAKRREFATRFPDHAAKVTVCRNAASPAFFAPVSRHFRGAVGTLCHIAPRKRVYDLILAFHELVRDGGDFHLHLGGDIEPAFADYAAALDHLVKRLDLGDRVVFHGPVRDPVAWYPQIDIFLSHSYSEGLQSALIDAMASGCVCFAHLWEGAEELLPPSHLYLSDRDLVEKIRAHSAASPAEQERQREQMRYIARDGFSLARLNAELHAVIDGAAAARRR